MISPDRVLELVKLHLASAIDPRKKKPPPEEPSWTIGVSKIDGRGVIATRDIKAGEIIFREMPLLIGLTGRKESVLNTCSLCYKLLDEKKMMCPKGCSLPICEQCSRKQQHNKECEIYRKYGPLEPTKIDPASLRSLTVIRGLFLKKEQKHMIYAMQANTDSTYRNEINNAAKCFKNFPTDSQTVEYFHRIVSVLNTNAFEVLSRNNGHEIALRGLYPLAGIMNHECTPNTAHLYEDGTNEMVVKATRAIPRGEEITTTYTKLLWSTKSRQLYLRLTKQFTCNCPRCKDPTERGTYLGAFYCRTQQCGGLIIQEDPTAQSSIWKCEKCNTRYDSRQMTKIADFALGTINGKANNGTLKDMIQFINEMLPKIVPPWNYLAQEAKLQVIWKMGKTKEDFGYTDYQDKEKWCNEACEILDKLEAGDCTLRHHLLEEARRF
ncbi:SET domain-containing protein SmydA-8-like [Condylostylus longicornis]|uniref:SET domain-containing protein SmydA-8-like n=1 Tax=Condylostylus longicornis TaxID=2530218 RepID=UPI00244E297A|nr:SET domain-containing protein SmydA-8-like [Condylostylus longicornis]